MGWLTSIFSPFTLNPALAAAGAGLVAVPIVIHMINRMRYRRVRFAAMEFLLVSQQRNRRRVLVEQLLLLLLRILIVLGLIFLLARLILDPSALAMIRAGAKTHHVVLLDDSASMRSETGGGTAFDAARDVVRQFVSEAAREAGSQQLTLILLSKAADNEALITERDLDEPLIEELDTKLRNLRCTHQTLDLRKGVEAARQRLSTERTGRRYLHVMSDFRQSDWLDQPGLVSDLQAVAGTDIAVNLVRVVGTATPNRAVSAIEGDFSTAVVNMPVRVRAGVTNFDGSLSDPATVTVLQDGQRLPISEKTPKIEPLREASVPLELTFPSAERHTLSIEVAADGYPADDRRFLPVRVEPTLNILIIDGSPSEGDGAGLLADALAPDESSGISPRVESIDFLRKNPLRPFRAIMLVNVASLPVDAVRPLEQYAREGGGVAWFLGDSVQPSWYNGTLVKADRGKSVGLFPLTLADAKRVRTRPADETLDVIFEPVLRFAPFAGDLRKYWRSAFVSTAIPPNADWERDDARRDDGVTTVARLAEGDPVILQHRFGAGQVVTFLTSAGQEWTNWPREIVYVALVQELALELATRPEAVASEPCGEPLRFRLPAGEYEPEIRIERPDGTAETLRAVPESAPAPASSSSPAGEPGSLTLVATYRNTDTPGIYRARLTLSASGTSEDRWAAYNVPLQESRLELADSANLRGRFAGTPNVTLREPGDLRWLRVRETGREARWGLLALLAGLLVAEQLLAYRLSYHPPVPAMAR